MALPAIGLILSLADATVLASPAGEGWPAPPWRGALVLLPLAAALAVFVRPVQLWLRANASAKAVAWAACFLGATYLALLAPQALTAEVFARSLVALALPFALFSRRVEGDTNITWRDVGFTLAVFALAGAKQLRVNVLVGMRNGGPANVDATFFVWMLVLALYLVVIRRLDLGVELTSERSDLGTAAAIYAGLMALLLPVAILAGFVPLWPSTKPATELLHFAAFYTFRVALGEELVFRVVFQNGLIRAATARWGPTNGPRAGLAAAALIFGLCHWSKGPWIFSVLASVAGFAYGQAYLMTGRLAAPVLLHGAVDLTHYLYR